MRNARPSGRRNAGAIIVAIPACDEEHYVGACLAALAVQRGVTGAPLDSGSFDVLVLANNCGDRTAEVARAMADQVPYAIGVESCWLSGDQAHAGGARRIAMDLAADMLEGRAAEDGAILTTDADTRVDPTWIAATLAAFESGADAVAGYVDPDSAEYVALGPAFGRRGRLEDAFLSQIAEIHALCDPRAHDPWPNHRAASGASLAVRLAAYRAIGGLPQLPLGEDAALVRTLEYGGFRVRHSLEARVTTSCRLAGRARGGAAETMRARHADPDAPCDPDLEPAAKVLFRATWKGRLRRLHGTGTLGRSLAWAGALGIAEAEAADLVAAQADRPFALLWDTLSARGPQLRAGTPLRPADLPAQIETARRLIAELRVTAPPHSEGPDDSRAFEYAAETAAAGP